MDEAHPDTWKPPMATAMLKLAERPRDIQRARILIGLNPDERDHSQIAVTMQARDQRGDVHARVRFVDCFDVDGYIGAQRLTLSAIRRDPINSGQESWRASPRAAKRMTYPSSS